MEALSAQMTFTSASVESLLEILSLLTCLFVVARLIQLNLYRTYFFFFTFLCIPLILETIVVIYGSGSMPFFYAFWCLEPLRNISYILVVWELFSAVFRNYAGLRSLSRWVMGVAAGIAPIGLILTILAPGSKMEKKVTMGLLRFERGITLGLVIFIVILLYFISKYPIKLPRNIVVLCMLYSVWFLGDSALLLSVSFLPKAYVDMVNYGLAMLEIVSYIGWAALLSKAGEYQETSVRHNISPERERILIGELNAMNDVLLRARRSIPHGTSAGR